MIEVDKKACKELLMRKILLAIVSSIALQFFFVYCFTLVANLSTDLTLWLQGTWTTIMSVRMWAYLIILSIVTVLQGVLCSKIYLCVPPYRKSRFARFCAIFAIQHLSLGMLYVIVGGVLIWLHLSLQAGIYSSLTVDCNNVHGTCLVEEHYFLLLSGLWSGLYFSIKSSNGAGKYFCFPIILQSKFLQLRQRIHAVLPMLMISSIWPTIYFMVGYYFLGSYCRTALLSVISLQMNVEPLNTVSRLLNLTLILQLWLHQLIFILTINSTYLLFEVCLTEWISFKLTSSGAYNADDSEITLSDVLSMDKVPIMQHLGYLDLVTLAQKEKIRRRALFTLSQPGGHPYNWNCIVQKCINLLKKFSLDLNAISTKLQDQQFSYNANILTASAPSILRKEHVYHMRRLVPEKASLTEVTDLKEPYNYNGWFIQRFIKQKRDIFVTYLFSKPLINYIFGEQEENRIRYILLNQGHPVIWAAEAISSLSVFSLSEDSYGIVQKDIPNIIDALLAVKQALDKLQKSPVLIRKMQADDKLVKEIFTALRSATKRSLYRIVTNFEPYIADLTLEPTVIEQLQGFLIYKE